MSETIDQLFQRTFKILNLLDCSFSDVDHFIGEFSEHSSSLESKIIVDQANEMRALLSDSIYNLQTFTIEIHGIAKNLLHPPNAVHVLQMMLRWCVEDGKLQIFLSALKKTIKKMYAVKNDNIIYAAHTLAYIRQMEELYWPITRTIRDDDIIPTPLSTDALNSVVVAANCCTVHLNATLKRVQCLQIDKKSFCILQ